MKEQERLRIKKEQDEAKQRELDEKRLAKEKLLKEKEEAEQRKKEEAKAMAKSMALQPAKAKVDDRQRTLNFSRGPV